MSAENQVSWSQLLLTSVLSVITSVAAGVLINEYLRWRREQAKKEEKPGEVKAVAEPRLREEKEYWLIEHHLETESFGTAPMMGGVVELGLKDGRVWMRKLWLPKEKYSREVVNKILASIEKCGLCQTGLPLEKNLINPMIEENNRGNMPVPRTAGFTVGGALFGKVVNDAMDYFLIPKLGATNNMLAKTLAGAALVLLPFGVRMGTDAETVFLTGGSYLIANVVDLIKQYVPTAPATRVRLKPVGTRTSAQRMPHPSSETFVTY